MREQLHVRNWCAHYTWIRRKSSIVCNAHSFHCNKTTWQQMTNVHGYSRKTW